MTESGDSSVEEGIENMEDIHILTFCGTLNNIDLVRFWVLQENLGHTPGLPCALPCALSCVLPWGSRPREGP